MRKVAFVAHDPGSCDALHPVFKEMEPNAIFLALGPSAARFPGNTVEGGEWEKVLQCLLDDESLAGVVLGRDWGTKLDVQLLSWACRHEVKSIVILDYWSNYATSFCDGKVQYWPDAYFVMDELARKDAMADGVPAEILHIVGQPGLDKFCATKEMTIVPDKDVLFLSQPLSVLYGESLGYTEQVVLADVQRACQKCGRKLEVKFHPKDERSFQQKYQDIAVSGDVDELMKHYKLIIGMSTMALLHAALMHVPIISYQPGLRVQDGCITNRLGLSRHLRCYEDLLAMLSGGLMGETCQTAESATRPIWMDGQSTFRAVEAVKEIIGLQLEKSLMQGVWGICDKSVF